ncbi:MAG TPA: hypothetical protein VFS21_20720 [Roseiflexaceae bacterium]|nr:hypothetical protein [Roseiflexaceae bacterium]
MDGNEQAADGEKQIERRVATLAHDMRDMLGGVASGLELLRRNAATHLPADQLRLLDMTRGETGRLLDLVSALVEIGHLERGQRTAHLRPCPADHLVYRLRQTLVAGGQIDLQEDLAAELPAVLCDEELLASALRYLLSGMRWNRPLRLRIGRPDAPPQIAPLAGAVLVALGGAPLRPPAPAVEQLLAGAPPTGLLGVDDPRLAYVMLVARAHAAPIWLERHPDQTVSYCLALPAA